MKNQHVLPLKGAAVFCFVLIICVSFLSLRCQKNNPADVGSTDYKPTIIASYPPNGGIGPYDIFTPTVNVGLPHFYIHFSQTMDPASFTSQNVRCQGFDQPVKVVFFNSAISHGDVIGFRIVQPISGSNQVKSLTYKIGKKYTITVDTTVQDEQGYQLQEPFTFSYTPEPAFRVLGFSFSDSQIVVPNSIEIDFNSKINSQTLQAMTITPALPDNWSIIGSADSTSAVLATVGAINPSTSYVFTVPRQTSDVDGNQLNSGVTRSFSTPALNISSSVANGAPSVNLSAIVTVQFNYPMDTASVRSAFSLQPVYPIEFIPGQTQLSFSAPNDFSQNMNYFFQLSTLLKTISGYQLPAPVTVSFHTAYFAMTHTPADNETGISMHSLIDLHFTGAIITSTVTDSAVTVTPPFTHFLRFDQDYSEKYNHVYYIPQGYFSPFTTYTVKVMNTIQSIGGYQLAQADSFSFTTGGS